MTSTKHETNIENPLTMVLHARTITNKNYTSLNFRPITKTKLREIQNASTCSHSSPLNVIQLSTNKHKGLCLSWQSNK